MIHSFYTYTWMARSVRNLYAASVHFDFEQRIHTRDHSIEITSRVCVKLTLRNLKSGLNLVYCVEATAPKLTSFCSHRRNTPNSSCSERPRKPVAGSARQHSQFRNVR